MDKKKRRAIRDTFGLYALRLAGCCAHFLPLWFIRGAGAFLGAAFYLNNSKSKACVIANLAKVYPDLSGKRRSKLARDFFRALARGPLQGLYASCHRQYLDAVVVHGQEHLDEALRLGKGVIALTAHLGNFAVMHWKLARLGYPVAVMQKPLKNKRLHDYVRALQLRMGALPLYSYPRTEAISGTIAALRQNKIVFIMLDQDFGERGIWVPFLGHLASTAPGPVVLALRTQAAVVPIYTYTDEQGRDVVMIMPRQELVIGSNSHKTLLLNAAGFTRIIEAWIREHPEQWGWITRRWRSLPQEKDYRMGRVAA